jgi:predicted O-linked N-acetylglucosamine transferase (SPINDLY family)
MSTDLLATAMRHHQAGEFDRAEQLYRQILDADRAQPDVWNYLGETYLMRGRYGEAVSSYKRAVELAPDHAGASNGLGVAYAQQNNWEQAVQCFQQAAEKKPDYFEAYSNLGIALSNQGKLFEAERSYRKALEFKADYPEALSNLGLVLGSLGKLHDAAASHQQALQYRPDFGPARDNMQRVYAAQDLLNRDLAYYRNWYTNDDSVALNELGIAYKNQKRLTEAITSLQEAIRLRPDFPEAWNNLGISFQERGNLEEAETSLREAIRLRPSDAKAHNNLGTTLEARGQVEEAIRSYREALRLQPDFAETHNNIGVALAKGRRYTEAKKHYQESMRFKPEYVEPYYNIGNAMVDLGQPDEALTYYQQALRLHPDHPGARGNYLFCLNYLPKADPEWVCAEHCKWGTPAGTPANQGPVYKRQRHPGEPLRIAYASPDLRAHVLASFLELILTNHDPKQVQVFGYAEVPVADETTLRLQSLCYGWRRTCGLSDDHVAEQVRADGIDIMVDLAGHTAGSRLGVFARKPAAVQVTYLGYPATTGLSAIDYCLTDAVADPPGEQRRFSEEPFRLANGFCCFRPHAKAPGLTPLPSLKAGRVTFGSLHKLPKLNRTVLDLWCELLKAVPKARLLVCQHTLDGEVKEHFAKEFAARGIGGDRVEFRCPVIPKGDTPVHLDLYSEIDISLDTFPWGGHTTACEGTWMGVPMLSLRGNAHAGRMVASVLTQVGLQDWIADTPAQYVELAVKWSKDLNRLANLRSQLRARMQASPLCDGKGFTRTLEEAYRAMWERA